MSANLLAIDGHFLSNSLGVDKRLHYARLYWEDPFGSLKRLVNLWDDQKGLLVEDGGELCNMLTVLSLSFRGYAGYVVEEDEVTEFPKPEGDIWKACLDAELPVILLDMIQDDLFFKQPFVWVQVVFDLSAAISSIWKIYAYPGASDAESFKWLRFPQVLADRYFKGLITVWNILLRERDTFLVRGNPSRPGRTASVIIVFAESIAHLCSSSYLQQSELPKFPSLMAVATAAWMRVATSPDPEGQLPSGHHAVFFQVIHHYHRAVYMLPVESFGKTGVWQSTVDLAVEAVRPADFVGACCAALLSWPFFSTSATRNCLKAISLMVAFDVFQPTRETTPPNIALALAARQAYWGTPILPALSAALQRESVSDDGGLTLSQRAQFRGDICVFSCQLLELTQQGVRYMTGSPPVVDGQIVYRILSACLLLLEYAIETQQGLQEGPKRNTVPPAVLKFNSTCDIWVKMCANGLRMQTQALTVALRRTVQGIKTAAKEAWYKDMRLLRSRRGQLGANGLYNTLVQSWVAFGKGLGMEETVERDQHNAHNKHMCSWVMCKFYLEPSPTPLSTCKGCGEQKYCSRECQKIDWKQGGHRDKCRRIVA